MYKTSTISILTVAALCAGLWLVQPQPANAQLHRVDSGLQQFAGTYWTVFQLPESPPLPLIFTLHADGTWISTDATDEGLGGALSVNSPTLGVYERSWSRQFTGRGIHLSFVDTMPDAAFVTHIVADFNEDFSGGEGVAQLRRYDLQAGENPLDPNQGTPWPGPGVQIPIEFGRLAP